MLSHTGLTALVLSVTAAPGAGGAPGSGDVEARVAELVLASDGASESERAAELRALGSAALEPLFRIADRSEVPAEWSSGEAPRALDAERRDWVWEALTAHPISELRPLLRKLADEASADTRATALELVAQSGTERDLRLAVRLGTPNPSAAKIPVALRHAFSAAVEAILARHPDGVSMLANTFLDAPQGLMAPIVQALGGVDSAPSMHALAGLLGRAPQVDAVVLTEIGRLARSVEAGRQAYVAGAVRFYLTSEDATLRQAAARAAGHLADADAVPQLLEILRDEDPNLSRSAHEALRTLTGLARRAEPEVWERWYEDELAWWNDRSAALFRDLERGDGATAARALREASRRRLFRDEMAEGVLVCLRRPEPDLVRMACAVLGHLASPVAVEELIRCLDHEAAEVRGAAHDALIRITGAELGPEARLWRARRAG